MEGTTRSTTSWLQNATHHVLDETGLTSLYHSLPDAKILIFQRLVRMIAYGLSTLILVSYLSLLGFSDTRVGAFMTLTLVGDVVISLVLALITDSVGRRLVLAIGAFLMTASGFVFAITDNYWILLVTAIFGVISPTGNEIGPFKAVEESTLSQISTPTDRSNIFVWYHVAGAAGTALGMIICGWIVDVLERIDGWDKLRAFRMIFFIYGGIGILKLALTALLSRKCELEPPAAPQPSTSEHSPLLQDERAPIENNESKSKKNKSKRLSLSHISPESRRLFIIIAILFALDNFASSLAPLTWIISYVERKFKLDQGYLGSIFFVTATLSTISIVIAAAVIRRLGNLKTMVFTHLPSAVALIFLGVPNSLAMVIILVLTHGGFRYMEVAPRSAFMASIFLPNERTAILGAIQVVRIGAMSLGPIATGVLAEHDLFWITFLLAGALKLAYDFTILVTFMNYKGREERDFLTREGSDDVEERRE